MYPRIQSPDDLWTLVLILAEVAIDVIIPFETANLINEVKAGAELGGIVRVGLVLVLLAMISLVCGGAAGFTGSKAASGFAKNVRHDLFTKVQSFSFENIDKFSSASLVTRMTTDIQNVQMAYMMCIRIAVRAPLMMIFSIIMAFIMAEARADLCGHRAGAGRRAVLHRARGHARVPRGVPQVR